MAAELKDMGKPELKDLIEAALPAAPAPAGEPARMTTGTVFVTYGFLKAAVERSAELLNGIPKATQNDCSRLLKELITQGESISKHAARLLEANR